MTRRYGTHTANLDELVRSITGKNLGPGESLFLKLPIEIRYRVYQLILPSTVALRSDTGVAHVWLRGSTSFLATCRQIHEEAANMLYGTSVFIVEVGYDTIVFRHRRLLESGLVPQATPPFLDLLGPNISRVRHIAINVEHVDSYTGMIKHNCGGAGLTQGLQSQVQRLVDALSSARELQNVRVHLVDNNGDIERAQTVLEPLRALPNLGKTGELAATGAITTGFARDLASCGTHRAIKRALR